METKNALDYWKTVKHAAIACLVGVLAVPVLITGCGSREVVVEEDESQASSESQEMLDFQRQMFNEQAQQINEQNQQNQEQQ
jgi:hypothetical protein